MQKYTNFFSQFIQAEEKANSGWELGRKKMKWIFRRGKSHILRGQMGRAKRCWCAKGLWWCQLDEGQLKGSRNAERASVEQQERGKGQCRAANLLGPVVHDSLPAASAILN